MQCDSPGLPTAMFRSFMLVALIAEHRMARLGKMDTNLVASTGF
jgi:hypothetical protein